MPRISVIVPVYNGETYLRDCVQSIVSQDIDDIEVILVDDCSSDGSLQLEDELAFGDSRIRVIRQETNGGTLKARKVGVAASRGDYVTLIDQDDSFAANSFGEMLSTIECAQCDILHFGVKVIAENDQARCAAEGMRSYLTPISRSLEGEDILKAQFSENDGFDWNVHHKLYRGQLAREAWASAEDVSLTLSDDLYVSFILSALATSYQAVPDSKWYVYHLGRGETYGRSLTLDDYFKTALRDQAACRLVDAWVNSAHLAPVRSDWRERCEDVRDFLVAHTVNELVGKLPKSVWQAAISKTLSIWSAEPILGELYRLVRDRAYVLLSSHASCELVAGDADLNLLFSMLEMVRRERGASLTKRCLAMKSAAESHLSDLSVPFETLHREVALFITTHKDVAFPHGFSFLLTQVGQKSVRFSWAVQDDSGDNIAEKNPMYCELTTQYWAWKNADADYYGFCHYRRYFDFSDVEHPENAYGEIMDGFIDWGTQERYGLDDESIRAAVEGYDVVTTQFKDLRKFPEHFDTPLDHYAAAPYLNVDDLRCCMDILTEMHPDYDEDAYAFLSGHTSCFCNMFIMRKDLFFRYCEWLFPILERFCEQWDTSKASHERLRTPGHLSERLLNIFLIHEKRVNPELKTRQLQCVHFEHPERVAEPVLEPCDSMGLPAVPVVFAADNNYVPMLTTTLYSVLKNASASSFYDVVVLEKDISEKNKELMRSFFSRFENASLRFLDVSALMRAYNLQTNNEHISVETYYRFLIQRVLPGYDKVLYLDADLIVTGDVAELFATELGDNLVAAASDIDYLANLNLNDGERMAYTKEVLGLRDPYGYFQAGVLVLNTHEMRELHPFERWLEIASEPKYIYDDQDILNAHCQGRVVYLDNSWNVMNDCGGRIKKLFTFAPAEVYDRFCAAYDAPKVVHYAGFEKPWKPGPCDQRELYWSYARETPFYEALLGMAAKSVQQVIVETQTVSHERVFSETVALRKVLDPVFPLGSRRREVLKSVGRILRGRK